MIYFVQPVGGGRIKIGTTIRLAHRLVNITKDAGCELRVLGIVDGGRDEEIALHARFSHLRVKGEWFIDGDELLDFIAEEGRQWSIEEDLPPIVITFRCRPEYKEWLTAFAKSERDIPSRLVDQGLIELAKLRGYPLPPER